MSTFGSVCTLSLPSCPICLAFAHPTNESFHQRSRPGKRQSQQAKKTQLQGDKNVASGWAEGADWHHLRRLLKIDASCAEEDKGPRTRQWISCARRNMLSPSQVWVMCVKHVLTWACDSLDRAIFASVAQFSLSQPNTHTQQRMDKSLE